MENLKNKLYKKTRNEGITMKDNIKNQFSKHYKRLEDDLNQIMGFTPVMKKIISMNLKNLETDIININEKRGYQNDKHKTYK